MGIVDKCNVVLAFFLLLCIGMSAHAENFSQGGITVESPWVKKSDTGVNRAEGYALIHNGSFNEDRLVSISSDFARRIVIHQTVNQYGQVTMEKIEAPLTIEPNGYLELKPGGYHFMFFNCQDELRDGEMIPAILHFEKNGDVKVNFAIEAEDDKPDNP